MAGGDEAQSAAAAEKPSEMELLRGMLQQQLELAAAAARREERMAALMERVLPGPTAVQDATAPAQAAAGPDSGARPRARMPAAGTPTPRLAATATLKEFEAWKEKFSGYCLLTGVHDLTEAEQRAALLAVLDDDWARVVRFGLPIPAEASMADVITAMHAHLRRQRNVVIDRCEFNMRMQEPGESVDDFICALKEIASCCDFCPNCTDDRFRDHLVVGTSDDEARRRMLELPDLTFQMAADLCRASESARLNSSAIRGPGEPSLRRLSEYRRQRGRPSGADSRPADQTRRCDRCGAAQHTDGRACPALGRTCHRCHERDHFSSVCRRAAGTDERHRQTPSSERSHQGQDWRHRSASSRRQGRGRRHRSASSRRRGTAAADASHRQVSVLAANTTTRDTANRQQSAPPAARTPGARLNSVTAHRSPQVRLQLHLPNGVRRSTVWTPDTGAEISALSLQQAESMGVSRADLTPSTSVLWAADSRRLDCVGTCALTLQLGDVIQTVQVSVLRALHSPLLSWHDCIGLGILPASFPRQICQRGSAAETGTDGGAPEPPPPGEPPEAPAAGSQPSLRRCSGTTAAPEETRDLSRVSAADRPAASSAGADPTGRPPPPGPTGAPPPGRAHGPAAGGTPSARQRRADFDELKAEFPRVFDTKSTLRKMTGEPMKIELTDDAVPHAVTTARNIPFCWREDVRLQLDELMEKDIIEPQPAPSSAPDGTEETAAAAPAGGQPAPPVLRNSADDPSSVRRGTRRRRRPARLTVRWADQTYD
ncbi:hypothetical protein FJT64_024322 [Amphibalanus amphitrite]|uniref:Retrotransposon gag domain-containing protein n=1 Tax=Amphibalanus amphitrite TaxID=1232801 RepID=A0A6A4WCL6_AMPAM|nr:hypothetical protein FJT64_024322 [Amphibalanus amphitrite]